MLSRINQKGIKIIDAVISLLLITNIISLVLSVVRSLIMNINAIIFYIFQSQDFVGSFISTYFIVVPIAMTLVSILILLVLRRVVRKHLIEPIEKKTFYFIVGTFMILVGVLSLDASIFNVIGNLLHEQPEGAVLYIVVDNIINFAFTIIRIIIGYKFIKKSDFLSPKLEPIVEA